MDTEFDILTDTELDIRMNSEDDIRRILNFISGWILI